MARWPEREPVGDPSDPRGFEVLVRRHLETLAVEGCSETTCETSRFILRQFGEWCAERGVVRPVEVTRSMVERYQRWIYHYRQPDGRALAHGTQLQRLHAIRRLFAWLARERYIVYNPASELVLPRKPPRLPVDGFTLAEVEQILASLEPSTVLGLRDRAMLETFYATGIRRTELVRLDLYDFERERGWLTVRRGKGDRGRVVPMGERARGWVARYLEDSRPELVGHPDEWALFVSIEGGRFTPESMGQRVRHLLRASGVRRRRGACHLFRHTMATLMLENGADVRYIQEMLGHAKLDTTQLYTRVSIQKLDEVHAATHPGSRLARKGEGEAEADPDGGDAPS